jgi:hypothetical protein
MLMERCGEFDLLLPCSEMLFLGHVGGDAVGDVIALILDGNRLMELASAIPASRYFLPLYGHL